MDHLLRHLQKHSHNILGSDPLSKVEQIPLAVPRAFVDDVGIVIRQIRLVLPIELLLLSMLVIGQASCFHNVAVT